MPALSDYTNVFDTALHLLSEKGYQLWFDEEAMLYFAEKEGWDFAASSPVGLLGVVAIFEAKKPTTYREYWWRDDVKMDGKLPTAPKQNYTPVYVGVANAAIDAAKRRKD